MMGMCQHVELCPSMETWRPLADWPGYEVSDEGRVRSRRDYRGGTWSREPRVLQPNRANRGYLTVALSIDGRPRPQYVHRLVLQTFAGPCPIGMEARHLNGDRGDNRLANLCWGTVVENAADRQRHGTHLRGEPHPNAKLTDDAVREIRALYATSGLTQKAIGERYGVSEMVINGIIRRKRWAHVD